MANEIVSQNMLMSKRPSRRMSSCAWKTNKTNSKKKVWGSTLF